MTAMSSSHARVSSRSERPSGSTQPRGSVQQGASRSEKQDPKQPQSPQPSATSNSHKRTASGVQRSSRGVDERRTERVQVTTRETLTSRTRSPERRPGSTQPQERSRAEPSRAQSVDPRPKPVKADMPEGMFLFRYDKSRDSSILTG